MEAELHKRIIGQESAVAAVSQSIRRHERASRPVIQRVVHLPRPHRCRQDRTRQDARRLPVRRREVVDHADMSEYMESASVSRLVGSPGMWVRRGRPAHRGRSAQLPSVVLFDEIEKAHPTFPTRCRSSRKGGSPTARAVRSTSATRC
jgi:ATP-dependent Clp protease ATP-binding subunit ClpC